MQAEEARRLTPLHRALHRPQQAWGGEREPMLFSMLAADGLIVSVMNWPATILGMCIWLVCVYGFRKTAKVDPNMSRVYVRQLKCGNYYGPFSRSYRVAKPPRIY